MQEQHAERARLYAQWRKIEWPILVDSMNLYGLKVVPIPMGLDESGRVVVDKIGGAEDLQKLLASENAKLERAGYEYEAGVRAFLEGRFGESIDALRARKDAPGIFRFGVALRARAESDAREPGDAQEAVDSWQRALALDPNQYIWRRRIQQYGPRLSKPYNFYGWIEEARRDIRARGEEPVALRVEPRGAEVMEKDGAVAARMTDADPDGKIARDVKDRIQVETLVTPAVVKPGGRVRVRFTFRPKSGKWNNEGEPLTVFVDGEVVEGDLVHQKAKAPHSDEVRVLECEIDASETGGMVPAYALYDVCVDDDGTCVYLRRDLRIPIRVHSGAVEIR